MIAPAPEVPSGGQITAAVYEDMTPGDYLLEIYNSEELLATEDPVRLHDNGIREAARMGSIAILDAIHDQEERINTFRTRYLPRWSRREYPSCKAVYLPCIFYALEAKLPAGSARAMGYGKNTPAFRHREPYCICRTCKASAVAGFPNIVGGSAADAGGVLHNN